MPIYEYLCQSCQTRVEVFLHNISQQPECPQCGSKKLDRQLSVIGSPVVNGGTKSVSSDANTCSRPCCGGGCMSGN